MKKLITFLFLIFLSATSISAQDQLILVSGDTVEGKIDILMPDDLFEEIMFQNDDMKSRYKAYQFISFTHDEKEYRTVKFGEKYRVMEVEKDGYLSLLRYRTDQSYSFNAQFLQKTAGQGIEVPNFLFKKAMANYLGDCGSTREAIIDGNYRKRDVAELVDDYNNCMANKTVDRMTETPVKVSQSSSPLTDEFNALAKQAKEMDDDELASMIEDVVEKLNSGDPVPNYLKNALKDHVSDGHSLKVPVEKLVGEL